MFQGITLGPEQAAGLEALFLLLGDLDVGRGEQEDLVGHPRHRPAEGIGQDPLEVREGRDGLRARGFCSTLYDMRNAITIRLDPGLEKLLDRVSRQTGRTRSDLVREALRRQLSLLRFEQLRRKVLPFAEARGYLTDEEIARDVS